MLKATLKIVVMKVIRYSGIPWLFREVLHRNRVTILTLHDPSTRQARYAFEFLARHYTIISLRHYLSLREKNRDREFPRKPLILTLDDGHISVFDLMPIIRDLKIPVTVFLCAGIVGTRRSFWFRHAASGSDKELLKALPNRERLAILEQRGFSQVEEQREPQALTEEQIRQMMPWVDFQAHTVFHPCLPTCESEEAWHEIAFSKEILERRFGLDVYSMAFPNGDFTDRELRMCEQAGFSCALTEEHGVNGYDGDPYRLRRISADSIGTLDELVVKSSGAWGYLSRAWNTRRRRSP